MAASQQEMEHYGLSASDISGWELLRASLKYKMNFTYVLKKMNMDEKKIPIQNKNNNLHYRLFSIK